MKLRSFLIVGLLGAVAASFASFEMMLLAGYEGVYRYDPVNNVNLGRFGQYDGTHFDVAVDPTRTSEVVTISSNGAVNRYNYSTGEMTGGFNVGLSVGSIIPRISVMSNGNILCTTRRLSDSYAVTRMYNPSGGLIAILDQFPGNYETLDSIQTAGGKVHTLVRSSGSSTPFFYLFNYSSAGVYQDFSLIDSASVSATQYGHLGIMNGRLWASAGIGTSDPSALVYFNSSFTGTPTSVGLSSYQNQAGATGYLGGHGSGGYMVHSYFSGGIYNNRIIRYNGNSNIAFTTNTNIPVNDTIFGTAIVVAPEPGTMIALGLGLAAVVRRRKTLAV